MGAAVRNPVFGPGLPVSSVFMFVTGLGLGLVMQVLVVAVQNSVPYSHLGTATSTASFFRSIGWYDQMGSDT